MATGAQAAQLMVSKIGQPTAVNTCVDSMVKQIFNPLGVPAPQTAWIPTLLASPLIKQVPEPFVGCIARWPRSKGYGHVSLITGISGNTLTQTGFGTGSGRVRSSNADKSFFESYWTPNYDGTPSQVDVNSPTPTTASPAGTSATTAGLTDTLRGYAKIGNMLSDPGFWKLFALFVAGGYLILFALIKLFADSAAGQAATGVVKDAAGTAIAVAPGAGVAAKAASAAGQAAIKGK